MLFRSLGDEPAVHPNTVRLTVTRQHRRHVMVGASLGAGRIRVSEIDGYPVAVDGSHHAIVLVAEDIRGSIARIAGRLSEDGVNIATLRLTRKHRGGDAFMVIEVDDPAADNAVADLKAFPWVRWVHRIEKVGG